MDEKLLQHARAKRARAARYREMAIMLSLETDRLRIMEYASQLEAEAETLEKRALEEGR